LTRKPSVQLPCNFLAFQAILSKPLETNFEEHANSQEFHTAENAPRAEERNDHLEKRQQKTKIVHTKKIGIEETRERKRWSKVTGIFFGEDYFDFG